MRQTTDLPVVLCMSGLDPTGGAGIQADIETVTSMGCHAAPLVTALTVQNTHQVLRFEAVDISLFIEQARCILEDIPVSAIKIGMTGSVAIIEAIHTLLQENSQIPVVLDPILKAGGGGSLGEDELIEPFRELLLPHTTVVTPNSEEARRLAPEADSLEACGQALLDAGSQYVLLTGTHEDSEQVDNLFFGNHRLLEVFSWDRLPHSYHGSGCTLASATAAMLAQGVETFAAVHEAQEFTWESLNAAYRISDGQYIPNRLFWTSNEEQHVLH